MNYYKFSSILSLIIIAISSCGKKVEKEKIFLNTDNIPVKTINKSNLIKGLEISATGSLTTQNFVLYSFKVGGVIDKIYVSEGQKFSKGQLLATIKQTEINSGVDQAQIGFEKAKRDYDRANSLYKSEVATLEQLQNSKSALDIANNQLQSVQFNQSFAKIYALSNGFVTKKIANEGEIVGSGMPVLAINETGASSAWIIKVGVSDIDWASIQIGNKANLSLDAFPDKKFNAIVTKKLLASDQNSGVLQVELKVNTEGKSVAVGMFGKVIIKSTLTSEKTVIPYDALIEANGNDAFVFVPYNHSKVKKVPIIIESFDADEVVVKSGLENVSEIIISNSAFLNEASTIKIIK